MRRTTPCELLLLLSVAALTGCEQTGTLVGDPAGDDARIYAAGGMDDAAVGAGVLIAYGNDKTRIEAPTPSGDLLALVGATLIDGTGAAAIADAVVVVDGAEIVAAGPRASVSIPEGAHSWDVSGKWLVPGLIDAHVHFMESGRIYTKPGQIDLTHLVPYEEEVAWMQTRAPSTLFSYRCAGVTGAVSVGGPRFEYEMRERAKELPGLAPDVYVAHGPVTLVPAELLFPPFDDDVSVRTATDPTSAAETIRQGVDWQADLVKTGYLGGPFAEYEQDYEAVHKAIFAEAAKHRLKVTTHVTELEPARRLVELGVDSLQHLPLDAPVDAAFLELAKAKGIVAVPTLAVWRRNFVDAYERTYDLLPIERDCGDPEVIASWYEVEELPAPPPENMAMYGAAMSMAAENTKRLFDAGIPLAAGSDSGNIGLLHGPSLHYELKLMGEAGVPPAELLVAATLNAARVAGQDNRVGSIEAGKQADMLLLMGDPLADIGNLQKISSVIKGGLPLGWSPLIPVAE